MPIEAIIISQTYSLDSFGLFYLHLIVGMSIFPKMFYLLKKIYQALLS